jgi:hypothetical protein
LLAADDANDTALAVAHASSGAEALARKVRKAKVVSASSTVPVEVLFDVFAAKAKDPPPAEPHLLRRRPGCETRRGDFDS